MVKLVDIINFCNEYLEIDKFKDTSLNGLQVEGKPEVEKIALGVSCNQKLFNAAKEKSCDLILVHHGLLWEKRWQFLRGVQKQRVKMLFDNDISLAAYHLPLDAHPEIGNNSQGLIKLGVKIKGPFGIYNGQALGFWGEVSGKISLAKFKEQVNKVFGAKSTVFAGGKTMIQSCAFISGGGRSSLEEAIEKGIDVFITGESNESVSAMVEESGIDFISSGHYNTEKLGVLALGDLLEKKFKVSTEFIDIPNNL